MYAVSLQAVETRISLQGDDASCLYVVISGRLRLLHESVHPVTSRAVVRAYKGSK